MTRTLGLVCYAAAILMILSVVAMAQDTGPDIQPTDLSDPAEVRQQLLDGINALIRDACTEDENVVSICVRALSPDGREETTCLPTDCNLTFGFQEAP